MSKASENYTKRYPQLMKKSINTNKTLEALEKNIWPSLSELDRQDTLIADCNDYRKIPLKNFTIENYRVLIGQDIGLEFLIPLAIEILKKDILAGGDCYPGDLLASIIRSEKDYWIENRKQWKAVSEIFEKNQDEFCKLICSLHHEYHKKLGDLQNKLDLSLIGKSNLMVWEQTLYKYQSLMQLSVH